MKFSHLGRIALALVVSLALGLGVTGCGAYTIGYMYVLGTQYNQISAYKIDNLTGNLTGIVNAPFSSGGANPIASVVLNGGRYLYVLNAGNSGAAGNIAQFSIGGDGVLTQQQTYTSQGKNPVWISGDSSGHFIYVLDQFAPDNSGNGDVTVFAVDQVTGRLSLVVNQQVKNAQGTQLTYFPVGQHPLTMKVLPSNTYMFIIDQTPAVNAATGKPQAPIQDVFAYQMNTTTGQLLLTQNAPQQFPLGDNLTAINSTPGGSYVYIADAGNNTIIPFTVGSGGVLQQLVGGPVPNAAGAQNPDWIVTDSAGLFVYMLNYGTNNINQPNSSITAYNIDATTGRLTQLSDSPYATGSGPVCMIEDPSDHYFYTSNHNDSTITGYQIVVRTGQLAPLNRGTVFPATGNPTCLAISSFTSA